MIRIRGFGAGRAYDQVLNPVGPRKGFGNFTWTAELACVPKSSPVAADLLRVGRAVHLADRLVRRGASISRNLRRIEVDVCVAEPVKWRRVASLLQELAEFATGGDSWSFSFKGGATDDLLPKNGDRPADLEPTVVALFSGGLDSLCGAAHLAAQKNSRPLFVTHSPPGRKAVYELAQDVFQGFGRELPTWACASYRLVIRESERSGVRSMFQEPSRRTRPFFYLSLAGATAIAHEVSTVQMSENGALALSLPYRADAHGPSVARQAHTFLLTGFEMLLNNLVPGVCWAVTNPFANKTKGEVCQGLGPAQDLVTRSASCEYLGRQRSVMQNWMRNHPKRANMFGNGPHCGLCVPCIVRRAALRRARVTDPETAYFASAPKVLREVRRRGTALRFFGEKNPPPLMNMLVPNVLYMERHCNWLAAADLSEFAIQYLPELRANRQLNGGPPMDLSTCHKLTKRYAEEILSFLNG
jgi:hypothetical protein